MILHQEMFQNLVDKIIADIGYNINIIDSSGIIIASGSKERVGTFHAIGWEAAKAEKRIDIQEEEVNQYKGVKEGVNQPFYYQGRLVGVIGITGKIHEIDEFSKVVKTMIELMVEQELLKQKMFHRQSNKSYFANLLLNIKTKEDQITISRWAEKLGYDLTIPRIVVVVTFERKHGEKVFGEVSQVIKQIKQHRKEDFSAMIGSNQLLILKTHDTNENLDGIIQYGEEIIYQLQQQLSLKTNIGIGSFYDSIQDQKKGYEEAIFCIEQLKKHQKKCAIGCIQEYIFEYLVSMIPKERVEHFLKDVLNNLKEEIELMDTLVALSKNHMNLVETSKDLFVHRNTVVFRIKKIKELSGLDPLHDDRHRTLIHLLATYSTLYM